MALGTEDSLAAAAAAVADHARERTTTYERQHPLNPATGAEEERAELEAYREQALLHKPSIARTDGVFEPFVGSRVGSPIPDNNGLGWPGAFSLEGFLEGLSFI
jgi:hypothetical protein